MNFSLICKILKSLLQLEFFEVSELSFAQDLIKGKEGMVKKLAGGDQKRTGLFKCIARGFRFIWSCVVGYVDMIISFLCYSFYLDF